MREALKRLQQAGLVSISQGGATRVRDWRHHGGLELLLEGDACPRRCTRRGRRWRCAPASAPTPRAGARSGRAPRCGRRCAHAAEQLAAVDDLAARNAHYEVLWDLIVDGADNIAYRLALTTLVARQRIASVEPDAVARELDDTDAIRALAGAIADGDADAAHATRPRPARTLDPD